jgi:hypothetical protein
MSVMLGGDKTWKQRIKGDLVVTYQWVNGEPALILFPKRKQTLNSGAFAICLSAAYQYANSDGSPTPYAISQALRGAEAMGFFPDKMTCIRIVDAIIDGIPDLIEMPPENPGYNESKHREVIGEMNIKQDGRVIRSEEITVPDSLEVSYGND